MIAMTIWNVQAMAQEGTCGSTTWAPLWSVPCNVASVRETLNSVISDKGRQVIAQFSPPSEFSLIPSFQIEVSATYFMGLGRLVVGCCLGPTSGWQAYESLAMVVTTLADGLQFQPFGINLNFNLNFHQEGVVLELWKIRGRSKSFPMTPSAKLYLQ